jgi:hypothetical protein
MEAEGRKPSGSFVPSDKPNGLRRSAITPELRLERAFGVITQISTAHHAAGADMKLSDFFSDAIVDEFVVGLTIALVVTAVCVGVAMLAKDAKQ